MRRFVNYVLENSLLLLAGALAGLLWANLAPCGYAWLHDLRLFAAFGSATYLVLIGLLVGKPVGILLAGMLAMTWLKPSSPDAIRPRELWVVGCAAGIGFTVALFVATVAFEPGPLQDTAKMGALCSCLAAVTAVSAARFLKVGRFAPQTEASAGRAGANAPF